MATIGLLLQLFQLSDKCTVHMCIMYTELGIYDFTNKRRQVLGQYAGRWHLLQLRDAGLHFDSQLLSQNLVDSQKARISCTAWIAM